MFILRRRFRYPAADLVSTLPSLDLAFDRGIRALAGRPGSSGAHERPGSKDVLVTGFPRSGNTFLIGWLRFMSRGALNVIDGRSTHSALDVCRFASQGGRVFLTLRPPRDAVASFVVRAGKSDDVNFMREGLRAWTAWYRTAGRCLTSGPVRVVPFSTITEDTNRLVRTFADQVFSNSRLAQGNSAVMAWLEQELRHESGQGLDLEGMPSEFMISLPRIERAPMTEFAREQLEARPLNRHLRVAAREYERLRDVAAGLDLLV